MSHVYETYPATWRGIPLEIRYCATWCGQMDGIAFAHLEIESDTRQALPVTETGYKSHFPPVTHIAKYGGPVAFVMAWLDAAAQSAAWHERERQSRQLSLF
ncbi:hypothetical protein [Stappia sp. ICDLI1TA098]